jgi:hypothetical protein
MRQKEHSLAGLAQPGQLDPFLCPCLIASLYMSYSILVVVVVVVVVVGGGGGGSGDMYHNMLNVQTLNFRPLMHGSPF